MRLYQGKKDLFITIEEDTSLNVRYVNGLYLSDVIVNSTDDEDWDGNNRFVGSCAIGWVCDGHG